MSTMLEQALIDAAALKEAALKNAESAILEKYASEVKTTINSLLEAEEEVESDAAPLTEDMMGDEIPLAATEGETACPCPDEKEVVTLEFNLEDLENALAELEPGEEVAPEGAEDLAAVFGAEEGDEESPMLEEDIEIPLELQEEIEIDEELLFEYPDSEEEERTEISETEELVVEEDEVMLPEGIDLDSLVEELIVDLAGDELTGWAGRPGSDIEYAKEIRLAKLAATEAKEQKEQLESAIQELAESNDKYKQMLITMKEKLEEVNLSNAKLLYMNRTLNNASLNERQKNKIVESIQKTDSVEEAKVIFETLQSTVESSSRGPQSLSEAIRRPSLSVPRKKTRKTQKDVLLKERFQRLAGISKTDKL